MSETAGQQNDMVLKNKQICRFCLTQDHTILSGIFDKSFNRFKSCAPLPIQVLACTSIEIFYNDGLPVTVCDRCRMILDYCYRIKLICRKSDMMLRQFTFTHVIPQTLALPKIPEEIIKNQLHSNSGVNSTRLLTPVPENSYNTTQNPRQKQPPPMEPNVLTLKTGDKDRGGEIQQIYY